MAKLLIFGIIAFVVLVVAVLTLVFLKPFSNAMFSDANVVGWDPMLIFQMRGFVYAIVIIMVGAIFALAIRMGKGGGSV